MNKRGIYTYTCTQHVTCIQYIHCYTLTRSHAYKQTTLQTCKHIYMYTHSLTQTNTYTDLFVHPTLRAGQSLSCYVPPCPAIGRDSWQDRGAGQQSRTPRPAIGRDKAGHSRTSPVPPCGGTTAEDVFMYCPALWRDKLSVHYLLGRFFFNRAVLAKTLRLACIVEGPRWGSPISCLVFCRVGPPKRKRPKEENW